MYLGCLEPVGSHWDGHLWLHTGQGHRLRRRVRQPALWHLRRGLGLIQVAVYSALAIWGLCYRVWLTCSIDVIVKGREKTHLEKRWGIGFFYDVNGTGMAKLVTSIPFLLGHFKQLPYTGNSPSFLTRSSWSTTASRRRRSTRQTWTWTRWWEI